MTYSRKLGCLFGATRKGYISGVLPFLSIIFGLVLASKFSLGLSIYTEKDQIQIGGELHSVGWWKKATDADIKKMGNEALKWWERYKNYIFIKSTEFEEYLYKRRFYNE